MRSLGRKLPGKQCRKITFCRFNVKRPWKIRTRTHRPNLTQIPLNSCFAGKLGSKVFLRSGWVLLEGRNTNCGSSKSVNLSNVGSVIRRDPAAVGFFKSCFQHWSFQDIAVLVDLPPSRVMVSMNSGIFTRFTSFLSKTLQAACHKKISRQEMLKGLTPLKFVAHQLKNQPLEKEIPFGNHHFQAPCWSLV